MMFRLLENVATHNQQLVSRLLFNQQLRLPPSASILLNKQSTSGLHLTNCLASKKAGRHKTTTKHDKPLTYEEANKPDQIGVRKSWNSLNTSGLLDGIRTAETSHEDVFIRKFVHGTWPKLLASDVIIKRRGNQIYVIFMTLRSRNPTSMYFLIGYTEEILSYILKCVVKLELQTVQDKNDLTYKYI